MGHGKPADGNAGQKPKDLAGNAAEAAKKMIDSEVRRHEAEIRAEEDRIKKEDRIIAMATAAKQVSETKLETLMQSDSALRQEEDQVADILKGPAEDTDSGGSP